VAAPLPLFPVTAAEHMSQLTIKICWKEYEAGVTKVCGSFADSYGIKRDACKQYI